MKRRVWWCKKASSGGNHESEIRITYVLDRFVSCFDSAAFFRGHASYGSMQRQMGGPEDSREDQGQTWPEFWSKCSKDFAGTEPAQPEKATSKKAPEKSAKTATVDENDSSGSGEQKKACDAKWDTYKGRSGAHGWHDYFQFMAKCM